MSDAPKQEEPLAAQARIEAPRIAFKGCPLCGSAGVEAIVRADCTRHPLHHPVLPPSIDWMKCRDCQHVFTNGYFSPEALAVVFRAPHQSQTPGHDFERQRHFSARIVEKVARHASIGPWLDVGFGNGSLLFTAQEWGFDPVGLDLREASVSLMRELGYEAHCVELEAFTPDKAFSVISMADVLENAPYPKQFLQSARRLLAPDGVLFLSMPSYDSPAWRLLDRAGANPYWVELEHYHNFSRQRLYELLEETGFTAVDYGVSERYRVGMEVIAKIKELPPAPKETAKIGSDDPALPTLNEALDHYRAGRVDAAKALIESVLAKAPEHFDALQCLAQIENRAGHSQSAEALFRRAIAVKTDFAPVFVNYADLLYRLRRYDEAVACYDRAIAISPNVPSTHYSRGSALRAAERFEEALASHGRALAIDPDCALAYAHRANVFVDMNRFEEAFRDYDKAVLMQPDVAEHYANRGLTYSSIGRFEAALADFDKAISLKPSDAAVHANKGTVLKDLGRFDEAVKHYEAALALAPDYECLLGVLLHLKMRMSDWRDLNAWLQRLRSDIEAGKNASLPFAVTTLLDDLRLQALASQRYVQPNMPSPMLLPKASAEAKSGKIRLGYFSADFHNHATAYLMAQMFELHDRDRFELIAFSFGDDRDDAFRGRLKKSFDQFHDVRRRSDREIAELSRELGIDIAIDLKGYTKGGRERIFALRCADIQVNYLGYPGSMGVPFMDYIIADPILIPAGSEGGYSEKIVYMPHSYQVNDAGREIAAEAVSREALGLPAEGFVFCCFNASYKITPEFFEIWMELLKAVDGSVLWLLDDNRWCVENLRREAEARGVSRDRLIFAPRLPPAQHLARHRAADLFLDALPCNAHTTASDALWAGLPVLTQIGSSFAARVAASLLTAMGLPEMIVQSAEDYKNTAIRLARNPQELALIRRKLADDRLTSELFDTPLFVRHIEAAYVAMHERRQAGLPPDHIRVVDQSAPGRG